jgi:hypothetical protein
MGNQFSEGGAVSRQTKLDLEAILARCEEATDGPWYVVGPPWRANWFDKESQRHRDIPTYVVAGDPDPHRGTPVCDAASVDEYPADDESVSPEQTYDALVAQTDADLEFIAHARTDVPQLVAALKEALERMDAYKREFARALNCVDKCFQASTENPQPILPDFVSLGRDKFEAVVRLAIKYRSLVAYLDDPNVLLAIQQPHRLALSGLLHGPGNEKGGED